MSSNLPAFAWRAASLLLALTACAGAPTVPPWEARLTGNAIVLLGEVHDNPIQHRERLASLRRAVERGWRPTIAMEQFDIDRQADIDRARAARPRDAQHLIEAAAPARSGWQWDFYRPVVELALQHELPLVAANLPAAQTRRIVREGLASVFEPARLSALKLDAPIAAHSQAAQEREIADGHCGALPARLLPAMASAQFARDAVMAELLVKHAGPGVVLFAGNGHVRRDIGVPRWLAAPLAARTLAIGYLEDGGTAMPPAAFDAVVTTPAAKRDDPCASFRAARIAPAASASATCSPNR